MTKRSRKFGWFAVAATIAAVAAWPMARPVQGESPIVAITLPADAPLSVMTYNVEGLPWPMRLGRSAALSRIADRLTMLRRVGRQPHIVMLQEAFSEDAKRIGAQSGYRYVVHGPSSAMAGAPAATPGDAAFVTAGRLLKGETMGKWLDSGLMILSDYPVVAVRQLAYPTYACAGYDCMANKGAVMAMVAVPGVPVPVSVVNTHLNSRAASGVASDRSLYAYRRQIDALRPFLQANLMPGSPLIVAGDFNVGKAPDRVAYFRSQAARWGRGAGAGELTDALHACAGPGTTCEATLSADAHKAMARGKDMQIMAPGAQVALAPRGVAVPFGHEADGSMLSDHIGYIVYYGVDRPRAAAPSRL